MAGRIDRGRQTSTGSISGRSTLSRVLTLRKGGDGAEARKGPVGLNTVFETEDAFADLIFVHGLGGGSYKTWSKDEDPDHFWPGQWLPQSDDFRDVRIHTFGYESGYGKKSVLNIHDFAKSLIESVLNSPSIPQDPARPMVLVCHSLGGLVAKRAFILAKQITEYHLFARRLRCIFFLATPHRGSKFAEILDRILTLTSGVRPFVNELQPGSATITAINEEFPRHCEHLTLYSFQETQPMDLGFKKDLIVPKESSVMGNLPNERSDYLDANHREVCKFANQEEPNYRKVRNALASTLRVLRGVMTMARRDDDNEHRQRLSEILGMDSYDEDFQRIDASRMSGSCTYIERMSSFAAWRGSSTASLFWLSSKPGAGKSVLSTFVINHFRKSSSPCSYFYFNFGDKLKATPSQFLRALAWQMSILDENVLEFLTKAFKKEPHLGTADARTFWRKVFQEGILKIPLNSRHTWVIDAFDDCSQGPEILQWLFKAVERNVVNIFVTCRHRIGIYGESPPPSVSVIESSIPETGTREDLARYISENIKKCPSFNSHSATQKPDIERQILDKSAGNFLWTRLVMRELREVFTRNEFHEVLDETPSDMDIFYERILLRMSSLVRGKRLAQTILMWTTCAARPLSVDEMRSALQLDIGEEVENIPKLIEQTCGQLVEVDHGKVRMIHQTAQDFILTSTRVPEFCMSRRKGNTRLAMVCLSYLNGPEMTGPKTRKLRARPVEKKRSELEAYACESAWDHVPHVSAEDDEIILELAKFVTTEHVLRWVEWISTKSTLSRLIQAGQVLKNLAQRRMKHTPILGSFSKHVAALDAWSVDLLRLATKFGRKLLTTPTSIYMLIPPFCPSASAIRLQFVKKRSIEVSGLKKDSWDDCISTITHQEGFPLSIACGNDVFVVGMRSGQIKIYDHVTCQYLRCVSQLEGVHLLKFGEEGTFLASAGRKCVTLWDTSSWQALHRFDTESACVTLTFVDDDQILLACMRSSQLWKWDTCTGQGAELEAWAGAVFEEGSGTRFPYPTCVAFTDDAEFVAVAYRGHDIILWNVEEDDVFDIYGQEKGSLGRHKFGTRRPGVSTINRLAFSRGSGKRFLAAAASDGTLMIFNTEDGIVQAKTPANVHTLVSSPTGQTLATGNSAGHVHLWEFDTLKLLYSIHSGDELGIQSVAFSVDGSRLVDIRGSHCRVWEPAALVRPEVAEDVSDTVSVSTFAQEQVADEKELTLQITAFLSINELGLIICGKVDSSVVTYDAQTGDEKQVILRNKAGAITLLAFESVSKILITVDASSRTMAHTMIETSHGWHIGTKIFDYRAGLQVEQVLCESGCSNLLMSMASRSELWRIEDGHTEKLMSLPFDSHLRRWWLLHPARSGQLLCLEDHAVHIFTWTLCRLTNMRGIELEGSILPELTPQTFLPCFDGLYLASTFSATRSPRSESKLFLWKTADFAPGAISASPVPDFQPVADRVQAVIGNCGRELIYLDHDGWVCSTHSRHFGDDNYERHFFFPGDWLTISDTMMMDVLENGDIIFIQREEVAVIKRGLDHFEHGHPRTATGKRPSNAGI